MHSIVMPCGPQVIRACGNFSIPGLGGEEPSFSALSFELSVGGHIDWLDSEVLIESFSEDVSCWSDSPDLLLLMTTLAVWDRVACRQYDVLPDLLAFSAPQVENCHDALFQFGRWIQMSNITDLPSAPELPRAQLTSGSCTGVQ